MSIVLDDCADRECDAGSTGAGRWSLPERHLAPGAVVITTEPCCVTTVLGSCVAVVLTADGASMMAVCHAVLPRHLSVADKAAPGRLRYVDHAIPEMVARFSAVGMSASNLRAKVFGGARVLEISGDLSPAFEIGARNIAEAELQLNRLGIAVTARDVGGGVGRKLHINSLTGDVLLRRFIGRKEGGR